MDRRGAVILGGLLKKIQARRGHEHTCPGCLTSFTCHSDLTEGHRMNPLASYCDDCLVRLAVRDS
jgi:hypothetical protein